MVIFFNLQICFWSACLFCLFLQVERGSYSSRPPEEFDRKPLSSKPIQITNLRWSWNGSRQGGCFHLSVFRFTFYGINLDYILFHISCSFLLQVTYSGLMSSDSAGQFRFRGAFLLWSFLNYYQNEVFMKLIVCCWRCHCRYWLQSSVNN